MSIDTTADIRPDTRVVYVTASPDHPQHDYIGRHRRPSRWGRMTRRKRGAYAGAASILGVLFGAAK